ncbi:MULTISPECIES: hypothetical protein [unclassified Methylobacterium]|uniref:hypothetical protein n=1 Tax=unclassified Methylobacterium TaxID=2615210 RepID=UPI000CBACF3E|nr:MULTISPECIES: hypothetical protein [unclassified Methylobacterium]PIU07346.1 MAG: hypothetical protein COT56_05250 [Methylobacterium sp. CG09_land_8_20_14_0_10_71_15]PIU11955.1 MAG: hypothetical protein COT28_17695 [Methylobacterium sp. CG08_land_8_20_14_0_20_71_15]GBU16148.1 hypothetical protein AwMethylo_03630 [Methylobacterium sp.]
MISALTYLARPADPDAIEQLADTLGALVAGVAAGLVGDAVIVSAQAHEAVERIADGTGAALVVRPRGGNPWQAGAKLARREWVLCLEAGDVPVEGWIRILDRFVNTARPDVMLGRLRRPHAGLPSRLAARGEGVIGVSEARAGDLVRRERLAAAPGFSPRLRPRPLTARLERA